MTHLSMCVMLLFTNVHFMKSRLKTEAAFSKERDHVDRQIDESVIFQIVFGIHQIMRENPA